MSRMKSTFVFPFMIESIPGYAPYPPQACLKCRQYSRNLDLLSIFSHVLWEHSLTQVWLCGPRLPTFFPFTRYCCHHTCSGCPAPCAQVALTPFGLSVDTNRTLMWAQSALGAR